MFLSSAFFFTFFKFTFFLLIQISLLFLVFSFILVFSQLRKAVVVLEFSFLQFVSTVNTNIKRQNWSFYEDFVVYAWITPPTNHVE